MSHERNDGWTEDLDAPDPRLADAFAALPRELPLVPGEEDRTVAALRELGLLAWEPAEEPAAVRQQARQDASDQGARVRSLLPRLDARAWRRVAQLTVGLAASLALFAGGTLWGEARASQRTLEALLQQRQPDARTAATLVQRAGSAYVTSVADFGSRQQLAGDPAAVAQGREVARAVLRAAAAEVVRLDPGDPLAREILRSSAPAPEQRARNIVWF
jgi:hypothetical protein